jgi:hypothetical protein
MAGKSNTAGRLLMGYFYLDYEEEGIPSTIHELIACMRRIEDGRRRLWEIRRANDPTIQYYLWRLTKCTATPPMICSGLSTSIVPVGSRTGWGRSRSSEPSATPHG